jgi:ABC-type amino acid transport substrate-binding protein
VARPRIAPRGQAAKGLKAQAVLASAIIVTALTLASCLAGDPAPTTTPATPSARDSALITLHFNERPPYLIATEDGVRGLTGDPTTLIFEKSGIPFQWKQTPSKRQIYLLQQNSGRDCLVGWFKNAEREQFARFTLPVYQDEPQFALVRADNSAIASGHTVAEVFANPQLTLLVKDGYSYGDYLDDRIAQYDPHRTVTTDENSGMLKMVFAGHADYFFIAPEEAEGLLRSSAFDAQDFKSIGFTDITSGEKRYILCSLQVEEAVIEQLNTAIRQYVVLPQE